VGTANPAAGNQETNQSPNKEGSEIARDVFISLILIVMAVFFEFIYAVVTKQGEIERLRADHKLLLEFLGKPFDLWTVGITLLVAVALRPNSENRGQHLVIPSIIAVASCLGIFLAVIFGAIFDTNWLKIAAPDSIGVVFIAIAVFAVTRK